MFVKHGYRNHSLYSVWTTMKQRCLNQKNSRYPRYGGKGITICDQWVNDPKEFIEWCISNGWKKGLEIDRKDNNRGYSPENCHFVTHSKNCKNTSYSKTWHIKGLTFHSRAAAADHFGVKRNTIRIWCKGQTVRGKFYPPKENCWSELKYK